MARPRSSRGIGTDSGSYVPTSRRSWPEMTGIVFERRITEIERHGAEPDLAKNLITLRFLDQLLEILRVAQETGAKPLVAGRAYYQISELFHVPWLRQAVFGSAAGDRWEQQAAQALAEDLSRAHYSLTRRVLESSGGTEGIDTNTSEFARFPRSHGGDPGGGHRLYFCPCGGSP